MTDIAEPIDTLTVYVNPKISSGEYDNSLKLKPRRVVFNPGAENGELAEKLKTAGFEVVEACTLVMLRTEQF
ncbi:MAG: CoA-binding protein [candidate division Zixibacteria bacterium]|nr:CoA-binding protein [candidate division Zixibacteria bacterium]